LDLGGGNTNREDPEADRPVVKPLIDE
jgi:hypothetical protein